MKEILEHLFEYNKLDYNQAKRVLIDIATNKYSNSEIASFITAFKMRNPSIEEMEGFRDALLELCVGIDFNDYNTIDLCGTGEMEKIHLIYQLFLHLLLQDQVLK